VYGEPLLVSQALSTVASLQCRLLTWLEHRSRNPATDTQLIFDNIPFERIIGYTHLSRTSTWTKFNEHLWNRTQRTMLFPDYATTVADCWVATFPNTVRWPQYSDSTSSSARLGGPFLNRQSFAPIWADMVYKVASETELSALHSPKVNLMINWLVVRGGEAGAGLNE